MWPLMQSRVRAQTSYEVSEWVNEAAQFLLATSVLTGYKCTIKKQGERPKTCSLLNKLSNRDTEHYPWHPICPSVTLLLLERWGIDQTVGPSDSVQFKAALLSQHGRNSGRRNHRSPPNVPVANNDMDRYLKAPRGVKRGKEREENGTCRLSTKDLFSRGVCHFLLLTLL